MKFTHKKPTVPGAYLWRETPESNPVLAEVGNNTPLGRWMVTVSCTEGNVDRVGGEWSERLVPVGEVQIAFVEGACAARHWSHLKPHELWDSGVKIRARRVVEGKEEV